MEENQTMTVTEALRVVVSNLGNIAVPRALNQMIGIPIDQAISTISACIEAMEQAEQKKNSVECEPEAQPGISELSIVHDTEGAEDGNADAE